MFWNNHLEVYILCQWKTQGKISKDLTAVLALEVFTEICFRLKSSVVKREKKQTCDPSYHVEVIANFCSFVYIPNKNIPIVSCRKHNPLVKGMSLQNKNLIIVTLQWQQGQKRVWFLLVVSPDVLGVTERTPQIRESPRTPRFTGTVLGHHSCHQSGSADMGRDGEEGDIRAQMEPPKGSLAASNHQDSAHQLLSPPPSRQGTAGCLNTKSLSGEWWWVQPQINLRVNYIHLALPPGIVLTDKLWRSCPVDEFHTLRRKLLTAVMTVASYRSQATMVTFSLVTLSSPDATLFLRKSAISKGINQYLHMETLRRANSVWNSGVDGSQAPLWLWLGQENEGWFCSGKNRIREIFSATEIYRAPFP